jgi:hypothetical protein
MPQQFRAVIFRWFDCFLKYHIVTEQNDCDPLLQSPWPLPTPSLDRNAVSANIVQTKDFVVDRKAQLVRSPTTLGTASSLPVSAKPTERMNSSGSLRAGVPEAINQRAHAKAIRTANPILRQRPRLKTNHN